MMKRSLPGLLLATLLLAEGCQESTRENKATEQDSAATLQPVVKEVEVKPQSKPETGQYCYINKVYEQNGSYYIDADYVQFLMGKPAVAAARKRGDAERIIKNGDTTWSLPNDYYILNENGKQRTLKLAPEFEFTAVRTDNGKGSLPAVEYLKQRAENGLFILTLDANETVLAIKEQYLP
ncbi:hypothetical protein [Filimonas effusa]|uniref:Uncharacterized protein n=1 Tax=Filimonas effusa TaxID=2508721 RepID=A0A4Q1CZE6_9BACT|nr:hypothetical protein [Filimonas effusa]RXK80778.1 hypothetical protein ESB13_21690 [Filimonas effusa]